MQISALALVVNDPKQRLYLSEQNDYIYEARDIIYKISFLKQKHEDVFQTKALSTEVLAMYIVRAKVFLPHALICMFKG